MVPARRSVRTKPLAARILTASRTAFRPAPNRCAISGSVGEVVPGFQTPLAISRPRAETRRSTTLTAPTDSRDLDFAREMPDCSEVAIAECSDGIAMVDILDPM